MIKPAKFAVIPCLIALVLAGSLSFECAGRDETTVRRTFTRVKTSNQAPATFQSMLLTDAAGHLNLQQVYTLPPLLPAEIESLQPGRLTRTKGRLQIGAGRKLQPPVLVNPRTVPAKEWTTSPNGWRTWAVEVTSRGSLGLRFHLQNISLPGGARLLVYDPAKAASPHISITAPDLSNRSDIWTETVFNEQAVIECQVPPGVDTASVAFQATELSHIYVLPLTQATLKEGSCHNDVSCYADWANEAAAVARISFVEHGNTYLCSGCLLAAAQQSSEEYFLTANHCIPNQSVASTIEFFWRYQTSSCDGPAPSLSDVPHTSGADLLAGSSATDFAFLRLKRSAPGGVSFLGWSLDAPANNENLTCIHHPDGSFERISFGHPYDADPEFWAVQWFSGVTEGGSSGSPLLNANHQVIGQLNGGFDGPGSSCDDPAAPDQFGRFDVGFNAMKRWLASTSVGGTADFTAVKGSYNGLFSDPSSGDPQTSSGFFTITITTKGGFSSKLIAGGQRLSMTGQFDNDGNAQVTINRRFSNPLTVSLQIDLSGQSDQITGSISDGTWNATLVADRNTFNAANPAPQAGQYTLAIPGSANDGSAPGGDGYATATVAPTGKITLTGSLADGTRISQSAFISRTGRWPLYISLYGGGGSIMSWLTFGDSPELAGDVTWIRPGGVGTKYYPGGFTLQLAATGSRYTRPASSGTILDLGEAHLVLSGGELGAEVIDDFTLGPRNRISNLGPGKLTLTFSASNGAFSGKLTDPSTATMATFHGVVLQDQNIGTGYFLGSSHSGQVFLGP